MNYFENGVTSKSIKKAGDNLREILHRNIDFRHDVYLCSEYYDFSFLIKETEEGRKRIERLQKSIFLGYSFKRTMPIANLVIKCVYCLEVISKNGVRIKHNCKGYRPNQ
jgi:hypothetical protein